MISGQKFEEWFPYFPEPRNNNAVIGFHSFPPPEMNGLVLCSEVPDGQFRLMALAKTGQTIDHL
jgi:hypothetical protein